MRLILRLAPLVLALCNSVVAAEAAPSGITVHRTRAGDPDTDGWTQATSTLGAFSVRLPCLFNDFSLRAAASEPVLNTDAVGCMRDDQRKYSASRFKYRQGMLTARKYFDRMSGQQRWEGETGRQNLMFNGFPAFQVDYRSTYRCGTIRAILVGSDLLTLTAQAPREACDGLQQQAADFLSSLQVTVRELDQGE